MRIDVVSDWSYYSDFRDSALGLCRVSYSSHCEIDTRFDKDLLAYRTTLMLLNSIIHSFIFYFYMLHLPSWVQIVSERGFFSLSLFSRGKMHAELFCLQYEINKYSKFELRMLFQKINQPIVSPNQTTIVAM